jgi:hypothetical protein
VAPLGFFTLLAVVGAIVALTAMLSRMSGFGRLPTGTIAEAAKRLEGARMSSGQVRGRRAGFDIVVTQSLASVRRTRVTALTPDVPVQLTARILAGAVTVQAVPEDVADELVDERVREDLGRLAPVTLSIRSGEVDVEVEGWADDVGFELAIDLVTRTASRIPEAFAAAEARRLARAPRQGDPYRGFPTAPTVPAERGHPDRAAVWRRRAVAWGPAIVITIASLTIWLLAR